jgi:hypothetical protein
MPPTPQTAFRLDRDALALLDVIQEDRGHRSRSDVIRFLIHEFITRLHVGSASWNRAARIQSGSPGTMREEARLLLEFDEQERLLRRKLTREDRARSAKIAECLVNEANAWDAERKRAKK